jgi:sulfur-carrier protein
MKRTKVNLFGAFRQYGNGQNIELDLPENASLAQLRHAFICHLLEIDPTFRQQELVFASAFADQNGVLTDEKISPFVGELAVLPPFCGG